MDCLLDNHIWGTLLLYTVNWLYTVNLRAYSFLKPIKGINLRYKEKIEREREQSPIYKGKLKARKGL